tara:strand:+ start:4326 stop:5282 length:957 start_codon:yes stop_codon:yes gene_type:complete
MKIVVIPPKDKLDYLAETIIEGLYKNNIDVYSSDLGNGIRKQDICSDEQIIEHSKDCDFIFVIWGKIRDNFPGPKYYLLDKINKKEKTVYIDGSEWTYTGKTEPNQLVESRRGDFNRRRGNAWINESMFKKCKWYFKRECYNQDLDRGIIPLLFGSIDRYFYTNNIKKKYDVFCLYGHVNEGLRGETLNLCNRLKNEGYNVIAGGGFPYEEFKEKLASSWIGIDAWGGGDCCARLWEILANNTMAMTQQYNIEFPNDFVDGESIVKYKTIEEFEMKIRKYLNNKNKIQKISENGYQHLLKYHTAQKRVEYILEIINEK